MAWTTIKTAALTATAVMTTAMTAATIAVTLATSAAVTTTLHHPLAHTVADFATVTHVVKIAVVPKNVSVTLNGVSGSNVV